MAYSAGILGTGFVGEQHAKGFEVVDGIEIAAVCDIDEQAVNEFGSEHSIPETGRYLDHTEMLADENLDVVSVTTPSFLHHSHVIDVAQSQASPDVIWCEKPIALSVSDAEEMTETCDEAGIELLINHSRRFSERYQKLRRLITEDTLLGEIKSVSIQYPRELLRNGTHSVDFLVYCLDDWCEYVNGHLTEEHGMRDSVVEIFSDPYDDVGGGGTIRMESGAYAGIDHTTPRDVSPNKIDLIGTDGRMEIISGDWTYYGFEESEWEFETPHESVERTHIEQPLPDALEFEEPKEFGESFSTAVAHIVDLLNDDAENLSPGSEATHVLEVLIGLFISDYTESRVSFPLDRPLRDVTVTSW